MLVDPDSLGKPSKPVQVGQYLYLYSSEGCEDSVSHGFVFSIHGLESISLQIIRELRQSYTSGRLPVR